ncbi:MAG: ABC transporter substrate-binding protein [Clostridia bacterium]|nr:ABC transporter substrate-binding protein [Clostridia bacterium]
MEEALKLKGRTMSDATQYHVIGWVAAKVMLETFKRAGSDLSGENLRKQLESIKDFDLGGLMPSVSYTSEDHRGSHLVKIQQVKNGKWTVVADNFDWKKP